ncbi:copper-binding protein [Caulobacter sp.]|uniref:copper-binding protein n=1 Tax=Caulobacter sp. TaxID=78 RepID=UPI003BAD23BF
MKNNVILPIFVALTLTACGPGKPSAGVEKPHAEAVRPAETGPDYDSVGVISSLEGRVLTLDHEGASKAGLPAGRDGFIAYADVLAEAPITPGARVTFRFRRSSDGLELTALKAR